MSESRALMERPTSDEAKLLAESEPRSGEPVKSNRLPDPLLRGNWERYWQEALEEERASDEDTAQLIEQGRVKRLAELNRPLPDDLAELDRFLSDEAYLRTKLFCVADLVKGDHHELLDLFENLSLQSLTAEQSANFRRVLLRIRDLALHCAEELKYDEANFVLRTLALSLRNIMDDRRDGKEWIPDILTPAVGSYIRHPMALDGCSSRESHQFLLAAIERLHMWTSAPPVSAKVSAWREQWKTWLDPEFWRGYYDRYGW